MGCKCAVCHDDLLEASSPAPNSSPGHASASGMGNARVGTDTISTRPAGLLRNNSLRRVARPGSSAPALPITRPTTARPSQSVASAPAAGAGSAATISISAGPCGHVLHHSCWLRWFARTSACPVCKRQTSARDLVKLYMSADNAELRQANEQIHSLQQQLTTASSRCNILQTENETITSDRDRLVAEKDRLIAEARVEQERIRSELEASQAEVEELHAQLEQLRRQAESENETSGSPRHCLTQTLLNITREVGHIPSSSAIHRAVHGLIGASLDKEARRPPPQLQEPYSVNMRLRTANRNLRLELAVERNAEEGFDNNNVEFNVAVKTPNNESTLDFTTGLGD